MQEHKLPTATDAIVPSWPAPCFGVEEEDGEGPAFAADLPVLAVNCHLLTRAKGDLWKPPCMQINVSIGTEVTLTAKLLMSPSPPNWD